MTDEPGSQSKRRRCVATHRFKNDDCVGYTKLTQLLGNQKAVFFMTDNHRSCEIRKTFQATQGRLKQSDLCAS